MEFVAKSFDELTLSQLYEILRSRSQIFMLEQKNFRGRAENKHKAERELATKSLARGLAPNK
jgi:predicted GNAT family N-acyltransferase